MWEDIQALVESFTPELRRAFMRSVAALKKTADLSALELAWANGDPDAFVYVLMGEAQHTWVGLRSAVAQAMEQAATQSITLSLKGAGDIMQVLLGLGTDPGVLRSINTSFITQLDKATRQALKQWLNDAMKTGENPLSVITRVVGYVDPGTGIRSGGVLGLNDRQMAAVQNFRRMLTEGSKEALSRALRDKRYDKMILRGDLSPDQIDKMVARYEARMLAYRANMIARTESGRAQAEGQRLAWQSAIDLGNIRARDLEKVWVTANDELVRPEHAEHHMEVRQWKEPFLVRSGTKNAPTVLRIFGPPHDPNCRCVCLIRLKLEDETAA